MTVRKTWSQLQNAIRHARVIELRLRRMANSWRWRSTLSSMVALIARSHPSCFHAERSTPPDHTSVLTQGFIVALLLLMFRHTARSEGLARRKASSHSNDTWIRSRTMLG